MRYLKGMKSIFLLFVFAGTSHGQLPNIALPKDGVWAKYKFKSTLAYSSGRKTHGSGVFTLKCLGTEHFEMKAYRWIEFVHSSKSVPLPYDQVGKMLISEVPIKRGSELLTDFKRGWMWVVDMPPGQPLLVEKDSENIKYLQTKILFGAPKKDKRKSIEKELIKTKFAELECTGWTSIKQPKDHIQLIETCCSNEKSPFGIVKWSLEHKYKVEDKESDEVVSLLMEYTLEETGEGAKSVFPKFK